MVDAKAIKDKVSKKISNTKSKISSHIGAHKHCRICGITIDSKADPRICKNQECIEKFEKTQKNDKMMRIMFFVFFAAIVAPIALQLFGFGA
mgnify:CR=1 FL=1|jgi:predicted nucleic acid-binding Zn ribbon protein